MIRACIFDLGGTLIDKYSLTPLISLQKSFLKKNIHIKSKLIRKDMGLDKLDHIHQLCKEDSIQRQWYYNYNRLVSNEDKENIYNDFKIILKKETVENMKIIPHTRNCISELKNRGIQIGVTTGFNKEQTELVQNILISNGVSIDNYVSSTCLDKPGRPEPHMIYENMDKLNIDDPRTIIKIDDTKVGIQEGLNADCITVGVARWSVNMNVNNKDEMLLTDQVITGGDNHYSNNYYLFHKKLRNSRNVLKEAGAHYVINNLVELTEIIEDVNNMKTPYLKNLRTH